MSTSRRGLSSASSVMLAFRFRRKGIILTLIAIDRGLDLTNCLVYHCLSILWMEEEASGQGCWPRNICMPPHASLEGRGMSKIKEESFTERTFIVYACKPIL
ncbi:uncharacterized protein LOC126611422 [Malus sylvestris]|uniref:uncharacterized protein LOC126611422 n=1 Tax=Malus sylvestris TaxID=3752 RepID=UPI0010AA3C3F|nr:uncharacterized protein LOC103425779 [Malus domestica]XP_050135669.1 uncharacterized protein LOC126611422 [Malus sylvestris]